jgi:predicted ATPase/transcriptional regulator with XRE-family HTH domain
VGETPHPFGSTLRRLRARAGLTQEQVAERAGVSAKAIGALERGDRQHPYPHTVRALAAALGLSPQESAALQSAVAPRGRRFALPTAPSPLIGRDDETRAVVGLLASGGTRLLTLTGPGGVGKTRLALAAAPELTPHFPDGVAFVPLARLRDPGVLLDTIASGLDLHESGAQPVAEVLSGYLHSRRVLLVLDNFEHLMAAAPEVAGLLATAPRVAVLTTSRAVLRVRGEQVFPVLPLPPNMAAELFSRRAAQTGPGPAAETETETEAVTEICRRLDGLPLAIELAAARTRVLPPAALLARLGQTLSVLTGGPRDLPDRQQTLRQTVAWSYDLLNQAEQALFRRLASFAGGWTLDAAAAVAGLGEATALELHTALLDSSLIICDTAEGEPRFELLETIRAYAAERLEADGEADAARDRHAAYYRDLAVAAGKDLYGPRQADLLDRLQLEQDNLRAAMARLLETGRLDDVASMCFALWLFWWIRGHLREGQHWTEETLARQGSLSASSQARLLHTAAGMLFPQGRLAEAGARQEEGIRLARAAGDLATLAWMLTMRGSVAAWQGQLELVTESIGQAEVISRGLGQLSSATMAVTIRAIGAATRGRLSEADELLAGCEAELRELRAPWGLGLALVITGWVAQMLGDHARLYGAADAIAERCGATIFPPYRDSVDRCRALAVAELGPALFEVLCREGGTLSPDGVVALATGRSGGHDGQGRPIPG